MCQRLRAAEALEPTIGAALTIAFACISNMPASAVTLGPDALSYGSAPWRYSIQG